MASYTVFDLFCGTGGFSYGMEHSGHDFSTRFGIDVLPIATETFKLNHENAVGLCRDIRKVRRSEVAEATGVKKGTLDVLIGGPPCQGFSSIRPFRSTNDDDPRNTLFEEYASFVNFFRPKVFVLENVVGLATHKDGATIAVMQECFYELGYDCDWRLVNAAHFGVPQKRERMIMIGAQRGAKIQFPEPTHTYQGSKGSTIGYRERSRLIAPRKEDLFGLEVSPLLPVVTVMNAISDLPPINAGSEATEYTAPANTTFQCDRRKGAKALTMHTATGHTDRMLEIIRHSGANISCIPKHLISSGFSSCYSRLDADEPSVTLTVNFVHPASNRCIHPIQHRALTPREGARLQSYDDVFKFAGNRTQVVKQIGNAVPPLLGAAIAKNVGQMLG